MLVRVTLVVVLSQVRRHISRGPVSSIMATDTMTEASSTHAAIVSCTVEKRSEKIKRRSVGKGTSVMETIGCVTVITV